MKLASGGHLEDLDATSFFAQGNEYTETEDFRDSVLKLFLVENQSHPFAVVRAAELRRWTESGEYTAILGGTYPRREGDSTAKVSEAAQEAAASYGETFQRTQDALGNLLHDVAGWMGQARIWLDERFRQPPASRASPEVLQPAGLLEEHPQRPDDDRHQRDRVGVAELPAQLRHVVEVHAVHAGDQGRYGGQGDARGDLAHVVVLLHRDPRQVGLERRGQQVVQSVDRLGRAGDVVVDVGEERPSLASMPSTRPSANCRIGSFSGITARRISAISRLSV